MSFYHIRSKERAKYEAVLQCPGLTGLQQGEHPTDAKRVTMHMRQNQDLLDTHTGK